jgi:hypothetical protein
MSTDKTKDIKRRAQIWAAYVKQSKTWVPKDSGPIEITDMDPRWRANAARWLLRRAATVEFYYSYAELHHLTAVTVEGASFYVHAPLPEDVEHALFQELDERASDPEAWLKTMPLYQALIKDLPERTI